MTKSLSKKIQLNTFLFLLSSTILFFFLSQQLLYPAEIVDKIVAIVNDQPITMSDVNREMILIKNKYSEELKDKNEEERMKFLQEKALDNLINEELQFQEAKKMGISISNKTVNLAIEDQKKNFNMSDYDLEQSLRRENLTLEEYKEKIRRELTLLTLMNNVIKPKVNITSTEIKEYYNKHIDFFTIKGEATLAQLVIAKDKNNGIEKDKIEEVLIKAKNGIPLQDLENEYENEFELIKYQYLGSFKKEELAEGFQDAFDLKQNECMLIETQDGFHIIKLLKKKGDSLKPFAEASEDIKNILYSEKSEKILKNFIESLKEKAYIEKRL